MKNEDYARQLCCSGCNNYVCYTNKKRCQELEDLLTIAQWKDEQFAKEKESFFKEYRKEILDACIYDFEQKKQQWIDKAIIFLYERVCPGMNIIEIPNMIDDFKKVVED